MMIQDRPVARFIDNVYFLVAWLAAALFVLPTVQANNMPATLIMGDLPVYSPGTKPGVIVDIYATIDSTLSAQKQTELTRQIADLKTESILSGTYYPLNAIESDAKYSLVDGARVELDGSPVTGTDASGKTVYQMSVSRSAYTDYLIAAAKKAIDMGIEYISLDTASFDLHFLSYDDEAVAGFASYYGDPTFNIRSYLTAQGYTDINSLRNDQANLNSDAIWQQWVAYGRQFERQWFQNWSVTLKAYAAGLGQQLYLAGNRYTDTADLWNQLDYLDYPLAETFLDSLGYPARNINYVYKAATAFGTRFWSWNFPANTAGLNGSTDPYATADQVELDKLFVAQTFANGGISQIGGVGWVHYHYYGYKGQKLAPYYRFVQMHPELFGLTERGEIAVLFSEAGTDADPGGMGGSYRGTTMLLADDHRPWDVVFAADPANRDGSEKMTAAQLSQYKAVVLPQARQLTDSQIGLLENYLNAGGTVIGFGAVAVDDTTGVSQAASRSFDDLFGSDNVNSTQYTGTVIAFAADIGSNLYNNADNAAGRASAVSSFNSVVDNYISRDIATDLPATVSITRYEDSSDGSYVIHLVNADWDSASGVVTGVSAGASFTFATPPNYTGTPVVSIMSPQNPSPAVLAAIDNGDGTYTVTLPALDVWAVLKIGSAALSPSLPDNKPWSQMHLVDNQLTTVDDNTATGGVRADSRDSSGELGAPYWYWKGGDSPVPWDVAWFASDDLGLNTIELYYRYSSDGNNWGNWQLFQTQGVSGTDLVGVFSFTAPDGEGHYQFYTRASDSNGQFEVVTPGDKNGFGVDTTAPAAPAGFAATGLTQGVWQTSVTQPVFTWTDPVDSLSGFSESWLYIQDQATSQIAAIYNLAAATQSWDTANANGNGMNITPLVSGQRYSVFFRSGDVAGNKSVDYMIYTFSYGTSPLPGVPSNIDVVPGDGELTVSWDNPADTTNFGYSRVYVRQSNSSQRWENPWQTADASVNSLVISGLTNDVEYEVAVEAVNGNNSQSGDMIFAPCRYTPSASGGSVQGQACTGTSTGYAVILSQSSGSTDVAEGGASDSYTVELSTQPSADVVVNLTTDAQLSVNSSSLTFTTTNWNTPQTVTVSAVDDAQVENTHSGSISHSVSSTDTNYNGLSVASISVNITDNDAAPGDTATSDGNSTGTTESTASSSGGGMLGTVWLALCLLPVLLRRYSRPQGMF